MKKKALVFVLTVIVALSFMANCSKKKSSPTSPAATATAVPTSVPVLYLYGSDTTAAGNFQALLDANGYSINAVAMATVGNNINLSSFSVIIISSDSAMSEPWGNTALVSSITNSAKPVMGLGVGGAMFFDTAGNTSIGWNNASYNPCSIVAAVNSSNSIWSSPNVISASGNITVYLGGNPDTTAEEKYSGNPPGGTTLVGQDSVNAGSYPMASCQAGSTTYFLWGFAGDTSYMTNTGMNLFVNAMKSLQ